MGDDWASNYYRGLDEARDHFDFDLETSTQYKLVELVEIFKQMSQAREASEKEQEARRQSLSWLLKK